MTRPGLSLKAQIDEALYMQSVRKTHRFGPERPAEVELHAERLDAILRTLIWLRENEVEIRAFLALPPEDRAVVVSHGPLVAQLAAEMKRREAIAKAGGPVR